MSSQANNTAATILAQLGGIGRLSAMTGAKNFIDHGNGASFKFANRGRGKPNHAAITLDANDTYTVKFSRLVKYDAIEIKSLSGVYADTLIELFERSTGLLLSL